MFSKLDRFREIRKRVQPRTNNRSFFEFLETNQFKHKKSDNQISKKKQKNKKKRKPTIDRRISKPPRFLFCLAHILCCFLSPQKLTCSKLKKVDFFFPTPQKLVLISFSFWVVFFFYLFFYFFFSLPSCIYIRCV
jgi:hypothetical protein